MRLRLNPIKCTGHGMCAELLPELIRLDPWGYPVLAPAAADVPGHLQEHAHRAAAACPVLAVLLTRPDAAPATTASTRQERRPGS